jgi:hypothetical protein
LGMALRVSDEVAHPQRARTEQAAEEGQGQCAARPWPDDKGMRRFAAR